VPQLSQMPYEQATVFKSTNRLDFPKSARRHVSVIIMAASEGLTALTAPRQPPDT
jgi:hypothetical protein